MNQRNTEFVLTALGPLVDIMCQALDVHLYFGPMVDMPIKLRKTQFYNDI